MTNWKTTLIGFVAGFLQMYAGGMNWRSAAAAAGIAALGMASKDLDVTGAGDRAHRVSS